jgi:ADP-ribosyl-[dinitrogen reductase] hydrolase
MKARTLEGAILSAVNLGGDADTVGACCGALAGAYWGFGAIPDRWKRDLEGYNTILHSAELLWDCAEYSL